MTYMVRRNGQVLGTCVITEQAEQAGKGYAEQYQEPVSVVVVGGKFDGREVVYYPGGITEKVWIGTGLNRWELTPAARDRLEARLYNMRYDMDLIGQEEILRLTIRAMSDGELIEMIQKYEEA